MMRTSTRTWTTILAAVASLSLSGLALAQPHDDHRDDRRDDHHDNRPAPPAGVAPVVAPPADPKIAEHLHQLEEQRQRDRKAAVKDVKAWNESRVKRAADHRNEIASTWGNLVSNPQALAELKTHADRMARLNRILDIANQKADNALASRCQGDIQREVDRDAREMQEIRMHGGAR
jgi:hypothetical protein